MVNLKVTVKVFFFQKQNMFLQSDKFFDPWSYFRKMILGVSINSLNMIYRNDYKKINNDSFYIKIASDLFHFHMQSNRSSDRVESNKSKF